MPARRFLPVLLAMLLAACATDPRREADAAGPRTQLTLVYRKVGAGMGYTPLSGIVVVPSGKHPPLLAALSLQRAVARFNAQLTAPEIVALKDSDTDLRWQSDIGPLLPPQLASYNSVATRASLRDRLFGVRFSGRLMIVDNELRFSIESRLFGRGAAEGWTELDPKDYDGSHFASQLSAALKQELLAPETP